MQGLGFWSCFSFQSLSSLWLCHLVLIEQSQCNLINFHIWSEKGQKRGTSNLTGVPKYCSTHVSTRLSQDTSPYRIMSFHGARAALLSHRKSAAQDRHRKTTFPFFSRHLMGKMYIIFPPLDSPWHFHEVKKPCKHSVSSGSSYLDFHCDNTVPLTVCSQWQKNKPCCVQCFPSRARLWFYLWGRAQYLQGMDPSACWHWVGFEPWPPATSISLSLISGSPRWGPEWVNISLLQQLPFICLYFRRGNLLTEDSLSISHSHSSQKQPGAGGVEFCALNLELLEGMRISKGISAHSETQAGVFLLLGQTLNRFGHGKAVIDIESKI